MILRLVNLLVDYISAIGLRIAEWVTILSFHVIHLGGRVISPVKRFRRRSSDGAVTLDLDDEF